MAISKTLVAVFVLTALPLAACKTFDERACPVEKKYTKKEMAEIRDAYRRASPEVRAVIADYLDLRDKSRACRGAFVPK